MLSVKRNHVPLKQKWSKRFIAGTRLDWKTNGPLLWRQLHTKIGADLQWINYFTGLIQCSECKSRWLELLKQYPPVFGDGYFEWTVFIHNQVNLEMNKPLVTVEQAKALHGI